MIFLSLVIRLPTIGAVTLLFPSSRERNTIAGLVTFLAHDRADRPFLTGRGAASPPSLADLSGFLGVAFRPNPSFFPWQAPPLLGCDSYVPLGTHNTSTISFNNGRSNIDRILTLRGSMQLVLSESTVMTQHSLCRYQSHVFRSSTSSCADCVLPNIRCTLIAVAGTSDSIVAAFHVLDSYMERRSLKQRTKSREQSVDWLDKFGPLPDTMTITRMTQVNTRPWHASLLCSPF